VVTVSADGAARIWDARTGRALAEPLQYESDVYSAQFSADGTQVVTVSVDGIARIWDAEKGRALTEPWWPKHEGFLLVFTPDYSRAAMMNRNGEITVWKESNRTEPLVLPVYGLVSGRVSAEFSADGKRLLAADFWGAVNVYEAVRKTRSRNPALAWLLADRTTRPISPYSSRTMTEHVSLVLGSAAL
jgi:WD40 repeat protein